MEKIYIDDLLKNNVWKISQACQTQLDSSRENNAKSHNYCEAIDIAAKNTSDAKPIYAPTEMKMVHKNFSSNRAAYESAKQVQFANGVTDYFCLFFCHADNFPKANTGENQKELSVVEFVPGSPDFSSFIFFW